MSFIEQQAPDAATPPSEHAPGISLEFGLSLAQELILRIVFALAGALIVGQINRMLAQFEHMRDLWLAGQLPNLPPPPVRAKPTTARTTRLRRDFNVLRTPGLRPERLPAQPEHPDPPAHRHSPGRPTPPMAQGAQTPPIPSRHAARRREADHRGHHSQPARPWHHPPPPFRYFDLPAPMPNCTLIVPYSNHSAIIGNSAATP